MTSVGLSHVARAADIQGTITNSGSGVVMQVQLFRLGTKGWDVAYTTTSAASGAYNFGNTVAAGGYKVYVSNSPSTDFTARWYDVAAPNASGWIGEDADIVNLSNAGSVVTGINVAVVTPVGIDGRVLISGTPTPGILVRTEWRSDYRYHHNMQTMGSFQLGNFHMRGHAPGNYAVLAHYNDGGYQTLIFNGPVTATGGNNDIGDITLVAAAADQGEPANNSPGAATAAIGTALHSAPGASWSSTGQRIGVRGTDVDWTCFAAVAGDRFRFSTSTNITVAGVQRSNPFVDPILGVFRSAGSVLISDDDDSGDGFNSIVDDLWIDTNETICVAVSTFGDGNFNGTGQGTAGDYQLRIQMLNRRPTLAATITAAPTPVPPAQVLLDEGGTLTIDLAFADIDLDVLEVTAVAENSLNAPMTDGVLDVDMGAGTGTWTWTASQTAANDGPYEVVFTVDDGELTRQITVNIEVVAINIPPTIPTPTFPANGATVTTPEMSLTVDNAFDADSDPLSYEFELYYGPVGGPPAQTIILAEGSGGQTVWLTATIPEDTTVSWRVRTLDGNAANGTSPWSATQTVRLDAINLAPPAPVITKPVLNSVVLFRRPAVSSTIVADPDGDPVTYTFELATSADFSTILLTSLPILPTPDSTSAQWSIETALDWGGTYHLRVSTADDRGAASPYSDVVTFRIKDNVLPGVPTLGGSLGATCAGVTLSSAPSSFEFAFLLDAEAEPVTLEVEIVDGDEALTDPDNTLVLASGSTVQDVNSLPTVVTVSAWTPVEDGHYAVRFRAFDGTDRTPWNQCFFWFDSVNAPPGPLTITSPADGDVVDGTAGFVVVSVAVPEDLEAAAGMPGRTVAVAYCASADQSCPDDPSSWSRLDPSEIIGGIGSFLAQPLSLGDTWTARACAVDQAGLCGPEDSVTFQVGDASGSVPGGCQCGAAQAPLGVLVALLAFGRRRRARR